MRRYFTHFVDDRSDEWRVRGARVVQTERGLAVQERRLEACLERKPAPLAQKLEAVNAFAWIAGLALKRFTFPRESRRSAKAAQHPRQRTTGRRAPRQHRAPGIPIQIRQR